MKETSDTYFKMALFILISSENLEKKCYLVCYYPLGCKLFWLMSILYSFTKKIILGEEKIHIHWKMNSIIEKYKEESKKHANSTV